MQIVRLKMKMRLEYTANSHLHFRVDYASVFSLGSNVVNFGDEPVFCEEGKENVVQVDGHDVEESSAAGRVDSVAGVISLSPCICSVRQAPIGHQIQHLLVRVVFTVL